MRPVPAALPTISVALGDYPHTQAVRACAGPAVFAAVSPISRAFAPMIRDGRYDVSEMALMTFLQARAYGKTLVLLPIAVAARFQEGALLCRAGDAAIRGPSDLRGKRVGVRAYSQTTGVWIRGVLAEEHGPDCGDVQWVTFEGAHVAEYADPPWAERAAAGADMLRMLQDGQLDAAIFGNDVPDDPGLRTVFPDPAAAAARFQARHGFTPVNHLVCVSTALLQRDPGAVSAFADALLAGYGARPDLLVGCAALEPAVALALQWMNAQGLLPRPLTIEEVWSGLPPELRCLKIPTG